MTLLTDDPWDTRDSFVLRHFAQGLPRLHGRKTIAIRNWIERERSCQPYAGYDLLILCAAGSGQAGGTPSIMDITRGSLLGEPLPN
ncbi:MAG: hypothetical protein DMG70_30230 [Acidobacteria bacterium]|nr:MAG: hypothetical protein DMG70_30230 [Acidobacteriota bacterium]